MADLSDDELLEALGVEAETPKAASRSHEEERVLAGFDEIVKFVDEHKRPPQHGDERDIFERLYAVRLDRIREMAAYRDQLVRMDRHGLLKGHEPKAAAPADEVDDDDLLDALGVEDDDITKLKHVKSREEVRAAEEIANRVVCADFDKFKPLFAAVQKDLEVGTRKTRTFERKAEIEEGRFFIVGGQMAYVAKRGEMFVQPYGDSDCRLRVIYDNGTESDVLMRSLQRALNANDRSGRRITEPDAGPLFGASMSAEDAESGTIYVLRSKSEHPSIAPHRELIHKIGVTGGEVDTRISNAKDDPTYLFAEAEVVATYKLSGINRAKLEKLLHKFFANARLDVEIPDRFGKKVKPREWFLVPLAIIDQVVEHVRAGTIIEVRYDPALAAIVAGK